MHETSVSTTAASSGKTDQRGLCSGLDPRDPRLGAEKGVVAMDSGPQLRPVEIVRPKEKASGQDLGFSHEITSGVAGFTPTGSPASVPITALVAVDSPRSNGIDVTHVERLAEADGPLPPILVHRSTMQIVDGFHRVAAALLRGHGVIQAHLLDGSLESAFVVGVRANVTHGLPLSLPDRRAAAVKILQFHANWSDRAIALATGLSAKTIGDIRSSNFDIEPSQKRMGKDGKFRPLDAAAGRRLAAELISWRPEASLREIAGAAGVSPGTVRDVRARLARGEDPVPSRERRGSRSNRKSSQQPDAFTPEDVSGVLNTLSRDPALRMNAAGRDLLRWLHLHAVYPVDSERFAESVPDHCIEHIAEVAHRCSVNWALIAQKLAERCGDAALDENEASDFSERRELSTG